MKKGILIFIHLLVLIIMQCVSYAQEKTETSVVQRKGGRTVLIFSTRELDKEVLDVLSAESTPLNAFVGTKAEKTVAVFTKGMPAEPSTNAPEAKWKLTKMEKMELKKSKETAVLDNIKSIVVDLDSIMDAFREFKVEQVELWISAAAETEGILRLAVSAKGEGGIKVILKPIK